MERETGQAITRELGNISHYTAGFSKKPKENAQGGSRTFNLFGNRGTLIQTPR